jgi:hypothetical protein
MERLGVGVQCAVAVASARHPGGAVDFDVVAHDPSMTSTWQVLRQYNRLFSFLFTTKRVGVVPKQVPLNLFAPSS